MGVMSDTTSGSKPPTTTQVVAVLLATLFCALLLLQLAEGRGSAARTVGIVLGPDETDGVTLHDVPHEGPAWAGGLRAGDVILAINGYRVRTWDDYDLAARRFEPTASQHFMVERRAARS